MAIVGKRVLAIIPARGGSKRFPGKNLAMFHAEPLVVRAVNQALASKYVDQVVVSSDSETILMEACPPATALLRPPELSTDESPTEDAIKHALEFHRCDLFVVLQPTSPTRSIEDIDRCIELAHQRGACHTSNFYREPNGAAYAGDTERFLRLGSLTGSITHQMPPHRSHDINTPEDLEIAQAAFER